MPACVISTKDGYRGESVKAVVVLREAARGQTTEQDIVDWCREHMAVYKAPRVVQFVDALPKTRSGKLLRRALQAVAEGRDPGDLSTMEDPAALRSIEQVLGQWAT